MSVPPEYFSRIIGEVDIPLLRAKRVVVAGVGQVGSKIAAELANAAVGYLRFIDHDVLKRSNLFRHVLPAEYVGGRPWNKADGLAVYLAAQVDGLETESVPSRIESTDPANLFDSWFADADLIVGSTDDPEAQLHIGRRALALGIPAIFPALFPHDDGGEIIVQLDNNFPCFGCAVGLFRTHAPRLDGVTGLGFFGLSTVVTAIKLSLAILDHTSEYAQLITPVRNESPHQFFELDRSNMLESRPLAWLTGCTSCGGAHSPLRADAVESWQTEESMHAATISELRPEAFVSTPFSPEEEQLVQNRSTGIRTINNDAWTRPPYTPPQLQHFPYVGSPATPSHSANAGLSDVRPNRHRGVDRVLFTVCAVIVAALVVAMITNLPSKPAAKISAPVSIKVDYSQALPLMIEAAHLRTDENDVPITETQFPVTSGPAKVKVVLIRLTAFKSSNRKATGVLKAAHYHVAYIEVLNDLGQLGYRPASLPELLAFIGQYPEMRNTPIVDLAGPVYFNKDVTCDVSNGYLRCVTDSFDQASEFLAVQK